MKNLEGGWESIGGGGKSNETETQAGKQNDPEYNNRRISTHWY